MRELSDRAHRADPATALFPVPPGEHEVRLNPIVPASDRKVLGGAITTGRRVVLRAVLPTLDDLATQVSAALDDLTRLQAEVDALRGQVAAASAEGAHIAAVDARLREIEDLALPERVATIEARFGTAERATPATPPGALRIDPRVAELAVARAHIDSLGDARLSAYWVVLPDGASVLDLSFGGAAAAHLLASGFDVRSVALDGTLPAGPQATGAGAEIGDPFDALDASRGAGLGGITALGLGDHLAPDQWLTFAPMAHAALADHGGLVLEMFNCTTPAALALRTRDPGLPPPTHPETIAFLLRAAGFRDVEVRYAGAFPDDQLAPVTPDPDWFEAQVNALAITINKVVVGQPLVAILARR